MSSLWFTKGMTGARLRHRRSPIGASERRWLRRDGFSQYNSTFEIGDTRLGLRVGFEEWENGLAVAFMIW
jgi:hypothetical protein